MVYFKWLQYVFCAAVLWCYAAMAQGQIDRLAAIGCMIEPSVRIDVSSPVGGVLETVDVKVGERLRKGQQIFSLRSDVEAASVALAKVRAEFSLRQYERNEGLYRDELISIHERDEFKTEFDVALQELEQAKAVLNLRKVRSTIDGVVIDRFAEPGEFVTNEAVLAIASLNPLKVEVVMPFDTWGQVAEGQQLTVYPAAPVGGQVPARVVLVDPIVDAASGTYRIRAEIDNRSGELPAGIECQVAAD